MQQVRLWEVISDQRLDEIPSNQIDLEQRLEVWLKSDVSVLDPNLLVIGSQVPTDFGGAIDLLCLDSSGDTVVIELKRGKTPREVTAQALDYASWVKDLSSEQLTEIADNYFGSSGPLGAAFQERFGKQLPEELNLSHRSLVVAESMDASTDRIVRYLSGMNVPINVATVQHFRDNNGREMLAQVYLIEPEVAEAKARVTSKRISPKLTVLHAMADENGIGELYSQVRNGVRGILSPAALTQKNVGYTTKLDGGGVRTVLIISAAPSEEDRGLPFTVHAARFKNYLRVGPEELRAWLPGSTREANLTGWSGSSADERENAPGFRGSFQDGEEVDKFINGLRDATARPRATSVAS